MSHPIMASRISCDGCGAQLVHAPARTALKELAIHGAWVSHASQTFASRIDQPFRFDWCLDCAKVALDAVTARKRQD